VHFAQEESEEHDISASNRKEEALTEYKKRIEELSTKTLKVNSRKYL
jgi:hypothetical protein